MRISVSVWEDKVSPVLDTAAKLLIVDNENQRESRFEAYLPEQDISQRCMFIRSLDVQVLICGAVSRHLSRMIEATGIKIISGISGPAEDVLKAYLQGNLFQERFLMPGRKFNHREQK
ncbi:MAG: NifB/NifX family molybdenum-iron cluster-binding protein [Pseudomonadota bacterium]